jgi:hypothetical protein
MVNYFSLKVLDRKGVELNYVVVGKNVASKTDNPSVIQDSKRKE